MNKESDKKRDYKKAKIDRENGLSVSYDPGELDSSLPHLVEEIRGEKESLKIDAVDYEVESKFPKKQKAHIQQEYDLRELENPTAIDFIRRCSTKEEAIEIIHYLLERDEISKGEARSYEKELEKDNGLHELIESSGGFKRPGYYIRKFYLQSAKIEKRKREARHDN